MGCSLERHYALPRSARETWASLGAAAGPTDVEELKRREEMERKKKEVEEKRERRKMENDELMNSWG